MTSYQKQRIKERIKSLEQIALGGMVQGSHGQWCVISAAEVAQADLNLLRDLLA